MNKEYFCIPEKSRILFFEPDTPAQIYIKYKPAAYQKVSQQTANPADIAVKGAKTRGNQISIKDVQSIYSKPSRGWDPDAPTTKLTFA
jgi:topoisomerase IV subunit A